MAKNKKIRKGDGEGSRQRTRACSDGRRIVGFKFDQSVTYTWVKEVTVSVSEGTTDDELHKLGAALVANEDYLLKSGIMIAFDECDHEEETAVSFEELGYEHNEDPLECRLDEQGDWEICCVHYWPDDGDPRQ